MQDTFYVDIQDAEGRWLNLRPHTSPMQVRYARIHAARHAGESPMPEVRVIAPGRVYRVDSDATHSPMFHQIEGLWLGESISFKDLKVVFTGFVREFFETDDFDAVSYTHLDVYKRQLPECVAYTTLLQQVYKDFGFTDIIYKVATRPAARIGSDEIWDKAEHALIESLRQSGCDFVISPGDGAFYLSLIHI